MDILSSGGRTDTPVLQKTFWAGLVGLVAAVLLFVGGLDALQTAAITTALPFAVIMVLICVGLFRALRAERITHDPLAEIRSSLQALPGSAVRAARAVPSAASTLAGAYGSGRPADVDAEARHPSDWRQRLRQITAEPEPSYQQTVSGLEEAQSALRAFFDDTVVPAFEQLEAELENQQRTVSVERTDNAAQIVVFYGEAEEFRYAIEGHAREDAAFAFPKFQLERRPARAMAKVVLRSGRQPEHAVQNLSQQRIIDDFLQAYAKWMGW